MKRVTDTRWERSPNVVAACDRLIGEGKKVSKLIITALADFRSSGSASAGPTD